MLHRYSQWKHWLFLFYRILNSSAVLHDSKNNILLLLQILLLLKIVVKNSFKKDNEDQTHQYQRQTCETKLCSCRRATASRDDDVMMTWTSRTVDFSRTFIFNFDYFNILSEPRWFHTQKNKTKKHVTCDSQCSYFILTGNKFIPTGNKVGKLSTLKWDGKEQLWQLVARWGIAEGVA